MNIENKIREIHNLEDYDSKVGVDYNLDDVLNAWAALKGLKDDIQQNVTSLSNLNLLDGVDKNNEYSKALKCVTGKGIGRGFADNIDEAYKRTKKLRDKLIETQYGISGDEFDKRMEMFESFDDVDFGDFKSANNETFMDKLENFFQAVINGAGLTCISAGQALAGSNPALACILCALGMAGTYASDGYEVNANTLYAGLSLTGLENKIVEILSGPAASSLAAGGTSLAGSIGYGTIALLIANVAVQAMQGKNIEEIAASSPETLLQTTVWVVVDKCVGSVAGPMAGSVCASVASNYCTQPFLNEDGSVNQGWCLAAEGGVIIGSGVGIALVSAGVASGPVGWIVLGCAAAGYGLVALSKGAYDTVTSEEYQESLDHYWDNVTEDMWLTGL